MAQVSKIQDTNGNQFDINAGTVNGHTVESDVPGDAVFANNEQPAEGGTTVSLVTTGDKWNWNGKSDLSNIAPPYNSASNYMYGDLCTNDGGFYSCISPTTGTWDNTKWRSVTVGEILTNLRGVIAPVMNIDAISVMVQKDELLDVLDYGDQLVIPWFDGTTEYELPFNFCHLETVKDENDNDVKVADFEAEYVLPTDCIFDASEAIYASANDLAAGDYYFKIANDSWGGNNGKYVCFTLADTLTAGKQIRKKSGAYNAAIENCTLGIYTDGTDTAGTALSFTVEATEPVTGTNLGQTDGTGDLNHWHCVALGYNRYKYSALRQYLNADTAKNTWWVQQHKWDVMPAYATTKDGFLYGLSADVKAKIKTTKIVTARNTVYNSGDTPLGDNDITYDKVFLVSLEQMYISPQVEGEGSTWEYYKLLNGTSTPYQRNSTYADLIKYGVEAKRTARGRWVRSCRRGSAGNEWYVNSSGYVGSGNATGAFRVAPCLRI